MAYWVTRTQRPVGQGGFHTASVEFSRNEQEPSWTVGGDGAIFNPFRYVYDCGEFGSSRSNIDLAVTAYGNEINGADLDVLFISHAHADHTNAVGELHAAITSGGGKIKTIILPLLDPFNRLITFAQSANSEDAAVQGLALEILIHPRAALSPLADDVIFVVGDDEVPDDFDPVDPDDSDDAVPTSSDDLDALVERLPFQLVGAFPVTRGRNVTLTHAVDIIVKNPYRSATYDGDDWLLKTFIDPDVFGQKSAFIGELKKRLRAKNPSADHLVNNLNAAAMRELLTRHAVDVTSAYTTAIRPKDANVTSMSLYSGPKHHSLRGDGRLRIGRTIIPSGSAKGWLLTGDACLSAQGRLEAFLGHFEVVKKSVAVFALPHHGSDHNFAEGMLGAWSPRALYTTNASPPPKWRHPATKVVNAVSSIGARMHVVTDKAPSTIVFTAGNAEAPPAS